MSRAERSEQGLANILNFWVKTKRFLPLVFALLIKYLIFLTALSGSNNDSLR